MSESKHTPGPWHVETWPARHGHVEHFVAHHGACLWDDHGTLDNPADALLIAAAPDMLDVLREVLSHFQNQAGPEWLMDRIDDAITKAEGGGK